MPKTDDIVKTTIRLPRALWNELRHRAIDEDVSSETLVAKAIEAYLARKKGGQK